MKKLILLLVIITAISISSYGQAPEGFKYQAVVRNTANAILINQAVGLRMTIQQGSIGGTLVYQETFALTTNAYGLVNLEIGTGTILSGTFTNIDWSAGPYFMETAVDITGGTNYSVMGTSQLMSVPYALYAKTSGNVQDCGLSVGQTYQGGIIFYLDGSGCHGLVAKATDEPAQYQWCVTNQINDVEVKARGIFGGAQNTKKIIALSIVLAISFPAAEACASLSSGGYTDWYLPSIDELDLMYVNLFLQGLGSFPIDGEHWSSTSSLDGNGNPETEQVYDGDMSDDYMDYFNYVRAIRAF